MEMFKCVHGLNPPYLNELFINKDTPYNLRDSNRLQQSEYKTVRHHFVTTDQNYGTPSPQRSSNLKIYSTLRKISRIGAFRVNVTCSSYNNTCDILPSIRNLLYYCIGFICRSIYVQLSSTCLCQVLLAQV